MTTLLKQKNPLFVNKPIIVGNSKLTKDLLRELNFHHSWGYFINNDYAAIRVSVRIGRKSKKTFIRVGHYHMYSWEAIAIDVNDITDGDSLMIKIMEGYNKSKNAFGI